MPTQRSFEERLGAAIRAARTRMGCSQGQVAARCGLGKAAISKAESGYHLPTVPTLIRLARGIGVSAWELLRVAEDGA